MAVKMIEESFPFLASLRHLGTHKLYFFIWLSYYFLSLFFCSSTLFLSLFCFPLTYHYTVGQQFEFINEFKKSRNYEVETEV